MTRCQFAEPQTPNTVIRGWDQDLVEGANTAESKTTVFFSEMNTNTIRLDGKKES